MGQQKAKRNKSYRPKKALSHAERVIDSKDIQAINITDERTGKKIRIERGAA